MWFASTSGGSGDPDHDAHARASTEYFAGGTVSMVWCLLVPLIFALFPKLRAHPAPMFVWHALCDVVLNAVLIASYVLNEPDDSADGRSSACRVLAQFNQFFGLASQNWYFAMALDLLLAIRNPFAPHKDYMRYYHGFVWSVSALSCVVLLAAKQEGLSLFLFCWIRVVGKSSVNPYSFLLFYAPVMAYFFFAVAVLLFFRVYVKDSKHFNAYPEGRRVVKLTVFQVFAFGVYWFLTGIVWFAQFLHVRVEGYKPAAYTSSTLNGYFTATIAARGLFDLILWVWCSGITWREFVARLRELAGCGGGDEGNIDGDTLPLVGDGVASARRLLRVSTMQEMVDGVRAAALDSAARRASISGLQSQTQSLAGAMDVIGMQPALEHEGSERVQVFERPGGEVQFYAYEREAFSALRVANNVDDAAFVASFARFSESEDRMEKRFEDGRNGSFRYLTQDDRYVVETVSEREKNTLLRSLPKYLNHVRLHRGTVIVPILGLFALRKTRYTARIYFIVTPHVFWTSLTDGLRGGEQDKRTYTGALDDPSELYVDIPWKERCQLSDVIRNDLDFLKDMELTGYSLVHGQMPVNVPTMHVEQQQPRANGQLTNSRVPYHKQWHNGFLSDGGERKLVNFIGFVDILRTYTLVMRIASAFARVTMCTRDRVPVLPSHVYMQRMYSRAQMMFVDAKTYNQKKRTTAGFRWRPVLDLCPSSWFARKGEFAPLAVNDDEAEWSDV